MFIGTGTSFFCWGGAGRKGVQWFFQPPPFNTVTVQSVFKKEKEKNNYGHPIYYLLSSFDKQCSCEWLVQFICQTVNSSHYIGVTCTAKEYVVGQTKSYTDFTPSECWVILFYIYIFILIFLIKNDVGVGLDGKKKKRERERDRMPEYDAVVFH